MKREEVTKLLAVCSSYQRTLSEGDPAVMRDAWFMALDLRMTVEEAVKIAVSLAAENEWLSPGAINDKYLAMTRKPHEQGKGRPKLYGQTPQPARSSPVEIGSQVPVRPQDVPEYVQAREAARAAGNAVTVPSWAVKCPHCGASPGMPCVIVIKGIRRPLQNRAAHPAREDAYASIDA